MKAMRTVTVLLLMMQILGLSAQELTTVSSRWSNSFVEWDIFVADETASEQNTDGQLEEEVYGEFKLRWLNQKDDFSEWTYEMGGKKGTIRQKWKNDPTQWELRTYEGDVVTMRAAWSNDLTEWRVTDNTLTLLLQTRWKNQLDEWLVDDSSRGRFYMYTLHEGDPRDWAVEDQLNDEISEPMKMALIFLTIFHSTPKQ